MYRHQDIWSELPLIDLLQIAELILKLYVFTRSYSSYFSLRPEQESSFMKMLNKNNIFFLHSDLCTKS